MATHLSKKEGFSGLWEQMLIRTNQTFYDVTLQKVKNADKVLSKDLRKAYGVFFARVASSTLAKYSGSSSHPLQEAGWEAWEPLSDAWLKLKKRRAASTRFYSGVTGLTSFHRQGSEIFTVQGRQTLKSYVASLKPIDVDDALGALIIQYAFRTKGKKFVTNDLQNVTDLGQKVTQTQRTELPSEMMITVEVLAFQNLKGGKMREWDIIDKIASELGDVEQWRKINATKWGRNGRPVRAVIGPAITRFMNNVSLPALQAFNETLK